MSQKQKQNMLDWKKERGKFFRLRMTHRARTTNRLIGRYFSWIPSLFGKIADVFRRVPKAQEWEKNKNNIELKHHLTRYQREFRKQMSVFIVGAFSFVAALVWNDAIKETLSMLQFNTNFLFYKYLTAAIVSVICVFVIMFLNELNKI